MMTIGIFSIAFAVLAAARARQRWIKTPPISECDWWDLMLYAEALLLTAVAVLLVLTGLLALTASL